ncbi:hypothetical protein GCM10009864_64450 [Streptomyces lunalinharesii]|uniref:Uncharacterized protein n=2 Tax=Streptomyces lunalinharesii TaxID=333384 RepID=A0ABP6F6X6_9ACTN
MSSVGSTNLHVGAAVAEIEGLYTALRGARDEHHRERILADLAEAGRRLTARTHPAPGNRAALRPRSRWERRRLLAARGADLVATFATGGGRGRWPRLRNRP